MSSTLEWICPHFTDSANPAGFCILCALARERRMA